MLTLFEELYLLTVRDDQRMANTPINKSLRLALAGAILAELALREKIQVNHERRVELSNDESTGDDILDRAMKDIKTSGKPRKTAYWVDNLIWQPKKLQKRLSNRMVANGTFTREDDAVYWAIPSKEYPAQHSTVKYCIKEPLRAVVLAGTEADVHSLALLSLAQASNLLNYIFTKDERKGARQKIHELLLAEAMKNPTAQAIEEIEAAVAS